MRIEALQRAFFWKGGGTVSRGQCLVHWKIVCRRRSEGGLGVLDLEAMNEALLLKWWWRFFTDRSARWCDLLKGLYYSRRVPLRKGASFRPFSQWWQGVLKTKAIFRCGMNVQIGDGSSVSFWDDRWAGQSALSSLFPNIFGAMTGKMFRVNECTRQSGWD